MDILKNIPIWIYPIFKNLENIPIVRIPIFSKNKNIPICNIPFFFDKWVYLKKYIYKKKPMTPQARGHFVISQTNDRTEDPL